MTQTVITNGRPRDVITWQDLTPNEQRDFDYLDSDERREEASFVRYRGAAYDLGEFMPAPSDLAPWQGIEPDTYFSGVLIRFVDHGESVIMGRYWQ